METWKPIKNYEKLYEVSTLGNVRSMPKKAMGRNGKIRNLKSKILKQFILKSKDSEYSRKNVSLYNDIGKRTVKVHRLVAETFIFGDKTLPVDHIDGNALNNRIENLRFATFSQNNRNRKNVKGYYLRKDSGVYVSRVKINKKVIYLGSFKSPYLAQKAHHDFLLANQHVQ